MLPLVMFGPVTRGVGVTELSEGVNVVAADKFGAVENVFKVALAACDWEKVEFGTDNGGTEDGRFVGRGGGGADGGLKTGGGGGSGVSELTGWGAGGTAFVFFLLLLLLFGLGDGFEDGVVVGGGGGGGLGVTIEGESAAAAVAAPAEAATKLIVSIKVSKLENVFGGAFFFEEPVFGVVGAGVGVGMGVGIGVGVVISDF